MTKLEKLATADIKKRLSEKVKIHEMKIFGSRARGDNNEDSDLDILIVVDFLNHELEQEISEIVWQVGYNLEIVIMPIVVTFNALSNTSIRFSSLISTINREGVRV